MEIDINQVPDEIEDDYPDLRRAEHYRSGCALLIIIITTIALYYFIN